MLSPKSIESRLARTVEPRTYPGSATLVNKLRIPDQKKLLLAEADFSSLRADQYRTKPFPGSFDLLHLKAIHFHLFQDIYSWAGHCRSYDMKKGHCIFCPAQDIKKHALDIFGRLSNENWLIGLELEPFAGRLAHYYSLINKLHPFPEGNGRSQRLFIEHLAAANGYGVNW